MLLLLVAYTIACGEDMVAVVVRHQSMTALTSDDIITATTAADYAAIATVMIEYHTKGLLVLPLAAASNSS